jgi:hypothetical protein
MDKFIEIFLMAGVGLIGFFLVRFYYLVDEIRKDVKTILIDAAVSKEVVSHIEEDVKWIKREVHDHEKRIGQLESLKLK